MLKQLFFMLYEMYSLGRYEAEIIAVDHVLYLVCLNLRWLRFERNGPTGWEVVRTRQLVTIFLEPCDLSSLLPDMSASFFSAQIDFHCFSMLMTKQMCTYSTNVYWAPVMGQTLYFMHLSWAGNKINKTQEKNNM